MQGKIQIKNGSTEFDLVVDDRQATFTFSTSKFTVLAKTKTAQAAHCILQFPTREDFEAVKAEGRLSNYMIISAME